VVFLDDAARGPACAEALLAAGLLGEAGMPVYLYGALAGGRTRAQLRRSGGLDGRAPDFGPARLDPARGAVLVAARPPLVAFNLFIGGTVDDARRVAAHVREGGDGGLGGVRALGMEVEGRAQVSTNVEDHRSVPLAKLCRRSRATPTWRRPSWSGWPAGGLRRLARRCGDPQPADRRGRPRAGRAADAVEGAPRRVAAY
jgi:hypothetical protein